MAPYAPDRSIAPVFFPVHLAPPGVNMAMSGFYPPMFAMSMPMVGGMMPSMGGGVHGGGSVGVSGDGSTDSVGDGGGGLGRGGSMDATSRAAPMSPTLSAALPDFLYAAIGSSSPPLTSRSPLQRRGGTFAPAAAHAGDVAARNDYGRPPVSLPGSDFYYNTGAGAGGRGPQHGESPLPQSPTAAGAWNDSRRGVRQFSRSAVEDAASPGRDFARGGAEAAGSPNARVAGGGNPNTDHGRMQSPAYASRGGGGSGSARGLRRAAGSAAGSYSRNELPPPQTLALREFRESVWRPSTLADLSGHVVDFACDGVGVYFLIDLLKAAFAERGSSGTARDSLGALSAAFKEVVGSARLLAMDAFGHLVLCSLFDLCSQAERLELAATCLLGNTLMLSLLVHGCRVVQKALVCLPPDFGARLAFELNDHLEECLHDANANHVVSKVVSSLDAAGSLFVLNYLRGNVFRYAIHPYGCRVLQNVFDVKSKESVEIIDELLTSVDKLACENYGYVLFFLRGARSPAYLTHTLRLALPARDRNFCVQHVLCHGPPKQRSFIIAAVVKNMLQLSQHKFASNVVERCLEFGTPEEKLKLVDAIVGPAARVLLNGETAGSAPTPLELLIRDKFGFVLATRFRDARSSARVF